MRAICFSNTEKTNPLDEILLWSHYAKNHRGVRIGFKFPVGAHEKFQIVQMTDRKDRVVVDYSFGADADQAYEALTECAHVKSEAWRYEQEFRLFTKTIYCEVAEVVNGASASNVEHFLPFEKAWVKSVDFGVLCPSVEVQRVSELAREIYPGVSCEKAVFHKTDFALEYRSIV